MSEDTNLDFLADLAFSLESATVLIAERDALISKQAIALDKSAEAESRYLHKLRNLKVALRDIVDDVDMPDEDERPDYTLVTITVSLGCIRRAQTALKD